MIKAIIFDMDGLMINSEPIQSKAYEKILKEYGKKPILNKEGIVHKVGIKERDNWELLCKKYDIDESIDVLMKKRSKVYSTLLNDIRPMNGLIKLLNLLKTHQFKIALASSSVMEHIIIVLSKLDISNYFDAIISGEDVKRGKPCPDINLEASKRIKVNPENCLVLEDAQSGIEAAKNADMKVIAIPNEFTSSQDLSKADLILDSLENIELDIISQV